MRYPRASWDEAEIERRRDADGKLYTLAEFQAFYKQFADGSSSDVHGTAYKHWTDAQHWTHRKTIEITECPSIAGVLDIHRAYIDALDDIHLTAIWYRLAKLDGRDRRLVRNQSELGELREHTLRMLGGMQVRGLSSISYSLARAGLQGSAPWTELWLSIDAEAQRRVEEFEPQNISNMLWAFSTAGQRASALFSLMASQAQREDRLTKFTSQALSNTAWSYAKANHPAPDLFEAIGAEARARLRQRRPRGDFAAQALSNTAWAFAKAGHKAPALFDAIGEEAKGRLDEFVPQGLANMAWQLVESRLHPV